MGAQNSDNRNLTLNLVDTRFFFYVHSWRKRESMGTYTGELKCNKVSVRITDTVKDYIESFEGDTFSNKFESMIGVHMQDIENKRKEVFELNEQIESLAYEKEALIKDITQLKQAKDAIDSIMVNIQSLDHDYVGEMIERKRSTIEQEIKKNGFKPNRKLIAGIEQLNKMSKKSCSVKEIADAFKNQSFKNNQDKQELINQIGREFKDQEMERIVESSHSIS